MGLTIEQERFDPVDYRRFERRLDDCLAALGRLLERPGFGTGPITVGAELELFLVDGRGRALPLNQVVREEAADPRVVLEIDRFNLELNLTPAPLPGRPFAAFASELDQALSIVRPGPGHRRRRLDPPGAVPAGSPQLLPGRPAQAPGRAGLAAGARRPGGDGPSGPAGPAAAAARPPGAGRRRGAAGRGRPATGRGPGPGRRRADRRRLAAPGPGRPGAALGRERALAAMLERYLELQGTNAPVHTWPVPASR
jgi:hypothetical protein